MIDSLLFRIADRNFVTKAMRGEVTTVLYEGR